MAFRPIHSLRLLIAVVLCFASYSSNSQTNHSFIAYQINEGSNQPIYYLPTEYYMKFKSSISIDSNFVVGKNDQAWIKLWIIENNMLKEGYRLSSLEGIVLNDAKPFLKELLSTSESRISTPLIYAKSLIDSLKRENAIFWVSPDLETKNKYVLDFEACYLNYPQDTIASKSILDSISYYRCLKPLKEGFFKLYPEINLDQVVFFSLHNECVEIIIRFENPNFDYHKLKLLDIYFPIEPKVRGEMYSIAVLQERI